MLFESCDHLLQSYLYPLSMRLLENSERRGAQFVVELLRPDTSLYAMVVLTERTLQFAGTTEHRM